MSTFTTRALLPLVFCCATTAYAVPESAPFPKGEFKQLWEPEKVMPLIRKSFAAPCKKAVGCALAFVMTSTGEPADPAAQLELAPGESAFRFMFITYPHKAPNIVLEYVVMSLDEDMLPSGSFYFEDVGAKGDFDFLRVTFTATKYEAACWSRIADSPCEHPASPPHMLEKGAEMYHDVLIGLSQQEFAPAK